VVVARRRCNYCPFACFPIPEPSMRSHKRNMKKLSVMCMCVKAGTLMFYDEAVMFFYESPCLVKVMPVEEIPYEVLMVDRASKIDVSTVP